MILLIDRNSNATWLMTLPLPAVTPKTVAKLTQNSGKQKVLTDIFLVFNNLFGFCMAGVAHEKEQKVCGFLLFKIEGEGNYLAA